jgi:hypothetical protein
MLSRAAVATAWAIGAGVILGIAGRASDYLGPELRLLFALGAPWFVVAWGVGALRRRPLEGAALGALALAVSVIVYYALMLTVEHRCGPAYATNMTLLWGVSAALCGVPFGAAGAAATSGNGRLRLGAITLLGGALAGEALLFLSLGRQGTAVLIGELVVGATLVLTASRPPRATVLTAGASVAFLAAAADGFLRVLIRARGWGG